MWLDRNLIVGPYLVLCLTQDQFDKAVRDLGMKTIPSMLDGGRACTHRMWTRTGNLACVVAISDKDFDGISVASLLIHEAVHVFQYQCEHIGESRPSVEFEAYGIQHIAEQLMRAYTILRGR